MQAIEQSRLDGLQMSTAIPNVQRTLPDVPKDKQTVPVLELWIQVSSSCLTFTEDS